MLGVTSLVCWCSSYTTAVMCCWKLPNWSVTSKYNTAERTMEWKCSSILDLPPFCWLGKLFPLTCPLQQTTCSIMDCWFTLFCRVSNRLYWFPIKQVYINSVYVESMKIHVPFSTLVVTLLWIILVMNFYWFTVSVTNQLLEDYCEWQVTYPVMPFIVCRTPFVQSGYRANQRVGG